MYVNFVADRNSLGYKAIIDTNCGKQLVLITDSPVLFAKNVILNGKRQIIVIVGAIIIIFSSPESAEAMGTNPYPERPAINIMVDQNVSKLIEPSKLKINLDIKPKIMMPNLRESIRLVRIKTRSDLQNSQWINKFISSIRGGDGDNEKLIRSIISKVSETDWDMPSINKVLKKLVEVTLEIGTNDMLLKILAELEKPGPQPSIIVEGFPLPGLPSRRRSAPVKKQVPVNKYCSPSIEALFDSTRCYAHREGYNTPRSVSENFETNTVRRLARQTLRSQDIKREYRTIKEQIKQGIHPVNLSSKSTFVSPTKVLIKKPKGRYLVEVTDTHVEIVGMSKRGDDQGLAQFQRSMNELYDLKITSYDN